MFFNTLSGRFLGLTILFVMIAEVLIFVPSVARFRQDYLQTRLDMAQLAALAVLATPDDSIAPGLEAELLETADVLNVVLQRDEVRELALSGPMPVSVEESFDIRETKPVELIRDALSVFFGSGDRIIRVIGHTRMGVGGIIEVTLPEQPLRIAMVDYGRRVLYLSLVISLATAALLFLAVQRIIVGPIRRVADNMVLYRDNPEDTTRIIRPVSRSREIQEAETALQDLQTRLTGALRQKERLAALGAAVAKISHDLRNILTTSQLLVDGLEASADPRVRRTAPKLVNSISRAVSLCERTLSFGKAEETPPEPELLTLTPLVEEVLENERQVAPKSILMSADVAEGLEVFGDPEQLFRVLTNLVRNAAQAIEASGSSGSVTVSAEETENTSFIRVSDSGPGLPKAARDNLFLPFRGSVRKGGAGLGLVIASEVVRGHGGTLSLEVSDENGTTFAIALPVRAQNQAA